MTKTVMFCPYTGIPRHPSDIASDPEGLLIVEDIAAPILAAAKKHRGRPALPPEQRQTERVEMRCTKAQRDKLERLGGVQWLRDRIDRAKLKCNPK